MNKPTPRKDTLFSVLFSISVLLSVYAMARLHRLEGEPVFKLLTDLLIVFLLLALNTAVLVLHEMNKKLRK